MITGRRRQNVERKPFKEFSDVVQHCSSILTNLSFYSRFWDADGRLCVRLQTSACFSLFPNDVSIGPSKLIDVISLRNNIFCISSTVRRIQSSCVSGLIFTHLYKTLGTSMAQRYPLSVCSMNWESQSSSAPKSSLSEHEHRVNFLILKGSLLYYPAW